MLLVVLEFLVSLFSLGGNAVIGCFGCLGSDVVIGTNGQGSGW